MTHPEGPTTQGLRILAPKPIKGMDLDLTYWVLGPSGLIAGTGTIGRCFCGCELAP